MMYTDGQFGQRLRSLGRRLDYIWALGLWLAAVLLFCWQLGQLPLRDWDEGIVAQMARQIWRAWHLGQATESFDAWLYPQDLNGMPYFNKPPLMHWLIALTYQLGGVNEWTSRLPGAMLTATSVPLLYWVGRELFYHRMPALLAAAVYLTYLPVVRQGRLAMLDGAIVCFFLVMLACLLRSRRDLRWSLGIGLGLGLMCMTKGMLGLLLGGLGLLFLAWDTPRLLTTPTLWLGLLLGMAPVTAWYIAQLLKYPQEFFQAHFVHQSFDRLWKPVEQAARPLWFYLIEVGKNGVPWLFFLPAAIRLAWEYRNLSWAKLLAIWAGGYFGVISLMSTKHPWYAMPLYPALALLVGAQLARMGRVTPPTFSPPVLSGEEDMIFPVEIAQYRVWGSLFGGLSLVTIGGSFYLLHSQQISLVTGFAISVLGMTFAVVSTLIWRHNRQFIPVLIWGTYVTLFLFVSSPDWNWELADNNAYAVKPVAEMVRKHTPAGQAIYSSYPSNRPSLDFYSDRRVIPHPDATALKTRFQTEKSPFLLVPRSQIPTWQKQGGTVISQIQDWAIVTRKPKTVKPDKTLKSKPSRS
ncbi:MAG: glycosyltransferase family 39 protein [Synechococcales bacterium]|nr:glycosyltransferase family 39 protein [Synechococcales bacterium]